MNYELTEHAKESLKKRTNIRIQWLEQALEAPHLIEPDPVDAELEHRLLRIDQFGGRVLRVVLNKTVDPLRIITVFFDRSMRGIL